MSTQELYSKLKCIRCGANNVEILPYKRRGVTPTCVSCRKKFQFMAYSNFPFFLVVLTFSIITAVILIYVLLAESFGTDMDYYNFEWFKILISFSLGFLIGSIVFMIVRTVFGSRLKKYFRDKNGTQIKSEVDFEWVSYRNWIKQILLKRNIPESGISILIEAEIKQQEILKAKNIKKGRIWSRIGIFFIILGIISLFYGFLVSYRTGPYWIVPFSAVHLPRASMQLLFGFIELLYGKRKKIFYSLQ